MWCSTVSPVKDVSHLRRDNRKIALFKNGGAIRPKMFSTIFCLERVGVGKEAIVLRRNRDYIFKVKSETLLHIKSAGTA